MNQVTKDEALLKALEDIKNNAGNPEKVYQISSAAIKQALAAPVHGVEIGWMDADDLATWIEHGGNFCHVYSMSAEPHHRRADKKVILYTAPPAAPEKGQP